MWAAQLEINFTFTALTLSFVSDLILKTLDTFNMFWFVLPIVSLVWVTQTVCFHWSHISFSCDDSDSNGSDFTPTSQNSSRTALFYLKSLRSHLCWSVTRNHRRHKENTTQHLYHEENVFLTVPQDEEQWRCLYLHLQLWGSVDERAAGSSITSNICKQSSPINHNIQLLSLSLSDLRSVPWGHAQIKTDAGSAETRLSLNQSAGILLEFSCSCVLPGKSAGCSLKRSQTDSREHTALVFKSLCIKTHEDLQFDKHIWKNRHAWRSFCSFMIHD